jgi:hypothetical protein
MQAIRMEGSVPARVGLLLALLSQATACDREPAPHGPFDHLLDPVEGRFLQVSSYDTSGGNLDRFEIAAGDSLVLLDRAGPAVIRRIWLTVSSRDPHYLRRIALKMYWDGEIEPSVSAPLGDFFGNGFEKRHYAALPMGVSSGGFYIYLPMPFRERARIVAENGTGRNIDAFYFNIDVLEVQDAPRELPTFHAWWHRDARTAGRAPHLILDAVGRGRFVGLVLNAQSHDGRLWFLEGDEIYHVDGEWRGQGTGTEDYFNSGWYFDAGEFSAPYHGLILKDEEHARIAAYRWHVPDPIPFHDSIRVELEHGHANEAVADYSTVAYWYQVEPHVPLPPLPPPDSRRVLSVAIPPGAIPAESLAVEARDEGLVLSAPVPRSDRYEVLIFPADRPDGGIRRYRVGATEWRRPSLVATDSIAPAPLILDTVSAADRVTVQIAGPELGSARDCAVCPCRDLCPAALWPRPLRRWAVEWSIVGPFANTQRLGTEQSLAIDSVYPPELDPDLSATYTAMNGHRVGWERAGADPDGRVRLNARFDPNDWVAAYAQSFLYSPSERETTLLLGADDAHALWVNGERVSERQGRHIALADDVAVPVQLRAGWNRVLLKVADLDGGWAFMLRAADPVGDLRWSGRPSP